MRLRRFGGVDALTLALLVAGAALLAVALLAAVELVSPPAAEVQPAPAVEPTSSPTAASDRVSTVLSLDAGAASGAAYVTRAGDRVDVLGYFPQQVTGNQGLTRLILQDATVLSVARSGNVVALTLSVTQDAALLLQEAQALGARPYIALRSAQTAAGADGMPARFSDADLATRVGVPSSGLSRDS